MEKLTPEEKELLEGLALACHEELVKWVPPKSSAIQCNKCKHLVARTASCKAYPKWIPDEVLCGTGCPEFEEK